MLIGKSKKDDPTQVEEAKDISGIACIPSEGFPRICMIVDDETQGVQVVLLQENGLTGGTFIRLINDQLGQKLLELDAEGVAYDNGAFYITGSHGRPRRASNDPEKIAKENARAAATRRLFRLSLTKEDVDPGSGTLKHPPTISESRVLWDLIQANDVLKNNADKPLDENGLTIEGIAVRNGLVCVGLRAPVLDGKAYVVTVPASVLFDRVPGEAKLQALALGTDTRGAARGIRDLTAYVDGFLVLAGPAQDPPDDKVAPGDYTIFAWSGATEVRRLLDLDSFGDKTKPEALLPLDERDGVLTALLLFDGPLSGLPSKVRIPLRRP